MGVVVTDGHTTLVVKGEPARLAALAACGFHPAKESRVAPEAAPEPVDKPAAKPEVKAPARSASRAVWREHAEGLGIDVSGMTRAQIQAAVADLTK